MMTDDQKLSELLTIQSLEIGARDEVLHLIFNAGPNQDLINSLTRDYNKTCERIRNRQYSIDDYIQKKNFDYTKDYNEKL